MDGFSVKVDELRDAANAVRQWQRDFAASGSLKYSVAAKEVGHSGLARALTEFHTESRAATTYLCGIAGETATRLHDSATTYQNGDQAGADAIGNVDRRFQVSR